MLPAFSQPYESACPLSNLEISSSDNGAGNSITALSSLTGPISSGSDNIVKLSDTSLHQAYSFFIKITLTGGSNAYFGPFTLNVGCFSGSVNFSNAGNFVANLNVLYDESPIDVYTFD